MKHGPWLTFPSSYFTPGSSQCSAASRRAGEKARSEVGGGSDGTAAPACPQSFVEVIDSAGIHTGLQPGVEQQPRELYLPTSAGVSKKAEYKNYVGEST